MADELWNGPVMLQSYNYPKHLVGFGQDGAVSLQSNGKRFELISPGLSGEYDTVSFKSYDKDEYYLRHFESELYCEYRYDNRNTEGFTDDATFRLHRDKWFQGTSSFESVNCPGQYVRHCDWRLRIDDEGEGGVLEKDASFRLVEGPFRLQSKNYPENFITMDDHEAYIKNEGDEFFIQRPGMVGGSSTVSLIPCCHHQDRVLRHYCSELNADRPGDCDNQDALFNDASFHMLEDKFVPGHFALESLNYPNHFVRHANSRLRIDEDDGSEVLQEDASFRAVKGPMAVYSYNYPDQGLGYDDDKEGYLQENNQRFWLVPGINKQPGTVSFQAVEHPNHYFRHYSYELYLEDRYEGRNAGSLPDDATFRMREDVWFENTVVFESTNFPGHFLRHQNSRLKISPYEDDDLYKQDTSFRLNFEQ